MKKARRVLAFLGVLLAVVVLASCGKKKITVIFDYNDGVTPEVKMELKAGDTILQFPANPTRDGYEFIGWESDGESFTEEDKLKASIRVVAVWEKVYSVTFNLNYNNLSEVRNVKEGLKIVEYEPEERLGYEFIGWYKDNLIFSKPFDFDTEVMEKKNLTLHAKWESYAVIEGVNDITFLIGDEELDLLEGVTAMDYYENHPADVTVDHEGLDFTKEGTYEVTYSATNLSGKESLKTILVTVVYENRLLIKQEDNRQQLLIQVKDEILGFYIEIAYQVKAGSDANENDLRVNINEAFNGFIDDVNIENGVIKIAATGLDAVDAYLLTNLIDVSLDFDLELLTLTVDTVNENNLVIK